MDLKILTYSMLINNNGNPNKKKSDLNYIDLDKLVRDFPLDMQYSRPKWEPYGKLPGFISKNYYQSTPETGYNYPPNGPIDEHFICTYCKQSGPNFHSVECKRPFESSLVLNKEFDGKPRGSSYLSIIKKPGQKKVVTDSLKSEKYTGSVQCMYQYTDFTKARALVAKNGTINIISANWSDNTLPSLVVDKINKSNALTSEYPKKEYSVQSKYMYQIFSQFQLFADKAANKLNLSALNKGLWESHRFKRVINGEDVFMLDTVENYFIIREYSFNSGETESRSGFHTNPYIKFNMVEGNIKTSVQILQRGSVQLFMGFINKEILGPVPLSEKLLQKMYSFIREMLSRLIEGIVIKQEVVTKEEYNTIDGRRPQACRGDIRPVPYSFYGTCSDPDYYVAPRGLQRPDGKFEPCCFKKKKTGKDSVTRYRNILKHGYPDELAEKYFENVPDPDNLSAVYSPGTKIPESRRFKGLMDLSKEHLLECIEQSGYMDTDNTYIVIKNEILKDYSTYRSTFQYPVALTHSNIDLFTKESYIVFPIFQGTVRALLFFNKTGGSFFINTNLDVSESGLPDIPDLAGTILDGYLSPFKTNFEYNPIDILVFKKRVITDKKYSNLTNTDRFTGLNYIIKILKKTPGSLKINFLFEENIVEGAYSGIHKLNVEGLLFIPRNQEYLSSKVNKRMLIWTPVSNDFFISLNVKKAEKWDVSFESKGIPETLIPKNVDIGVKFAELNKLSNNDIVLFKIVLNRINNKIVKLEPVEKVSDHINDYQEVISVLQSIQDPIKKETFEKESIKIRGTKYSFVPMKPLQEIMF